MGYLRSRVFNFIDDRLQLFSLFGMVIFCTVSILNYFETPIFEWELRSAIYGAGIFLVFFLGHKGTWITWCIVAYVMFYFSTFRNISYFGIIVLLISFYPVLKIPMITVYGINVFVISHLHELELMKVVFHVSACLSVYLVFDETIKRVKNLTNKRLELLQDEIIILEYLSKGIKQNDIPDFCPETVSRKLRKAKIRNGISNTKLLVERFRKENDIK